MMKGAAPPLTVLSVVVSSTSPTQIQGIGAVRAPDIECVVLVKLMAPVERAVAGHVELTAGVIEGCGIYRGVVQVVRAGTPPKGAAQRDAVPGAVPEIESACRRRVERARVGVAAIKDQGVPGRSGGAPSGARVLRGERSVAADRAVPLKVPGPVMEPPARVTAWCPWSM